MACLKLSLPLVSLVLHGMLFLSCRAHRYEEEDNFSQGINSYRLSQNLPNFIENSKADCLADTIADQLEGQTCKTIHDYRSTPGTKPNFTNFEKLLDKCHINVSTTVDGAIWPLCVPDADLSTFLVFYIYSNSQYAKYLKDSNYTGAGIGAADDWIVVVLSTNTSTGNFSGAASLVPHISMANFMVALLFGFLLIVFL